MQSPFVIGVLISLLWTSALLAAETERIDVLKQRLENPAKNDVMVIAHRGCWAFHPENSIASLEHCVDLGVEIAEIDVQLTADNVPVVFHDGSLDRTTNGWGYLSNKTLAEVKELYLRERTGVPGIRQFDGAYLTNMKVPTFAEVLEALKGKLFLRVDIKTSPYHSFEDVLQASVAVAERLEVSDHIHWNINTPSQFSIVASQPFVMPIIWRIGEPGASTFEDYSASNVFGFETPTASADTLVWASESNPKPHLMGVAVQPLWGGGYDDRTSIRDPDSGWGKLVELGATMIQTDRPEALISYLEARGLR